jgi:solute carrier family 35 (UDP-sugar transporter), member A1/2/3
VTARAIYCPCSSRISKLTFLTLVIWNEFRFTYAAVVTNAAGGLLVAVVVKYADNILKGFATSVAIILSGILNVILFDASVSTMVVFGVGMVRRSGFVLHPALPCS